MIIIELPSLNSRFPMVPCFEISVKRSEVPEYLHESGLYLSLSSDDHDDEITVPSNCMKQDSDVHNAEDFEHLLLTMRYWVLEHFSMEVIALLVNDLCKEYKLILQKYQTEFSSVLNLVVEIERTKQSDNLYLACKFGRIDFVDYFIEQGASLKTIHLQGASDYGHLDCLRYLYKLLTPRGPVKIPLQVYFSAARHGQLSSLRFFIHECRMDWERMVCNHAALHSQLPCLQFLVESLLKRGDTVSCDIWQNVMRGTAVNSVCCLKYLLSQVPLDRTQNDLVSLACRTSNVPALMYLVQEEFPVCVDVIADAARSGSMDCLRFLHDHVHLNCWEPSTMATAAGARRVELVKQLHELGCLWDESAMIAAINADCDKCLMFLIAKRGIPKSAEFNAIVPQRKCRFVLGVYNGVHSVVHQFTNELTAQLISRRRF